MQNKLKNIVLIGFILFINACSHKTSTTTTIPPAEKANFTKATIIKLELDGCSWMVKLEDGKNLEPVNLKEEFHKENLKVWIQYEPYTQGASFCMAGEMITVTAIEVRK